MQLTTRRKIPYPDLSGDDTPVDLPQLFHDRAVILDGGVDIDSGTLAARPTSTAGSPGIAGRQFIVTDQSDSPRLDLDIGVGWVTVGPAPVDGAANVPSLRTLGSGANQATAGNDPRLVGGANASGDLTGVYPGPMTVASWNGQSKAAVVAGNPPQTHGSSHRPAGTDPVTGLTDASIAAGNIDGAAGTPSMRTLGGGGQQAMAGNATPTPGPHAAQHKYAGSDPLVSLTPTLKNTNYVAVVGDLVIMSGSNNVITLPNAPAVDGAQCAVLAVTAAVTVNRAGTDTITTTSQGQLTISVAQGTSVVFTYHSGVWYGLVSGSGGGATGLVPLSPPSRGYRNAAMNVVQAGWGKIPIDSKSYDPTGMLDNTTGNRFNIQSAGYYLVDYAVEVGSVGDGGQTTAAVYKNGSVVSTGGISSAGAANSFQSSAGSDVIQCNAGDYLELYGSGSAGAYPVLTGSQYTFMAVTQVAQVGSPPAGQGLSTMARAYRNGAFTVPTLFGKITLDAKLYDPGSCMPTADRYVCPATGYYLVHGQVLALGSVGGNAIVAGVAKNGAIVMEGQESQASNSSSNFGSIAADVIQCNAGDYLELWGVAGSASAGAVGSLATYLSVVQIGGSSIFGALSPTAQSAPYTAGAGQLVLMTGANTVTLPAGPVPGSQIEVMALTAQVPVNRSGTDTINNAGVAGQQSVTVNAGQAIIFSYLGGVWYASPVGGGQSLPQPARAWASTSPTFGANVNSKIPVDTRTFDPGGNFDLVNHRYVAPVAGFYEFTGNVLGLVSGTGTYDQLYVMLYKNGVVLSELANESAVQSFAGATFTDILQLNAGDYVELWVNSTAETWQLDNAAAVNYLAVRCLGVIGAPTPGQGQATVARAYRNAAFNSTANTWVKVPLDTVSNDPGGNINLANSRYVCPVTGYYQVGSQAMINAAVTATTFDLAIYKNGTAYNQTGSQPTAGGFLSANSSDIIFCQAGDYLEQWIYVTAADALVAGPVANYLSVSQIAGTNLVGALSPTAQSAAYSAGAGQRVLMTGANAVTLPNAPMAGSTVAVNALTGVVPVNRSGSDTINRWGTAGLASLSVAPGSSVELQYLNGVWYVIRGLEVKPRVAATGSGQTPTAAAPVITGLVAAAQDIAGGIVASGNGFAVPIAGIYRILASLTLQPIGAGAAANSYGQLTCLVNGAGLSGSIGAGTQPLGANMQYPTLDSFYFVHLNAGDVITLTLGYSAGLGAVTVNSVGIEIEYVSQ